VPKNVIIIGMARSGTSLTTSIFAEHGYYIDEQDAIAPKNSLNPKGYWESLSLNKFNESILNAAGFEYDNTWIYKAITSEQVDHVDQYKLGSAHRNFLNAYEKNAPWAWKDPRLCYTLGCWWPLLDKSNTVVLLVRRDSEAIYNSFIRAGWRKKGNKQRKLTFERIDAHIANAKKIFKKYNIPTITINYEDFKKNPSEIVEKINRAIELNLTTEDLGYDDRFNHHKLSGRLSTTIDKLITKLPSPWIKIIKRLVPKIILSKMYPERYEQ
jgi:hypothetical protein